MLFGLVPAASKTRSAPSRRSVRLGLEGLETRYCPSTLYPDPMMMPPPATAPAAPATAPSGTIASTTSITLCLAYGTGHTVILSGHVTDPNPGGLAVHFGGVVNGQTVTDVNGNYQVSLTASSLGTIGAWVIGSQGGMPVYANASLTNIASVISNFTASEGASNIWTFTGTVTDEHAAGLTVSFMSAIPALMGKTATVQADGTFSLTVQLNAIDAGMVMVSCMDWWNLNSNMAMAYVT